jgi:phosphatidylglycerol lysyltransferase
VESCIALGEPSGPPPERDELVWRFREECERHGAWAAFHDVRADALPLYLDLGLTAVEIGADARVPTRAAAPGSPRSGHERAARAGASLSREPRGARAERFTVALAGRPVAWADVRAGEAGQDLVLEGLEVDASADPSVAEDLLDFLLCEVIDAARAAGRGFVDLGLTPLPDGAGDDADAPVRHRLGTRASRLGAHFQDPAALRAYVARFDPVLEPRWLAAPGGPALPRVLGDLGEALEQPPRKTDCRG